MVTEALEVQVATRVILAPVLVARIPVAAAQATPLIPVNRTMIQIQTVTPMRVV